MTYLYKHVSIKTDSKYGTTCCVCNFTSRKITTVVKGRNHIKNGALYDNYTSAGTLISYQSFVN